MAAPKAKTNMERMGFVDDDLKSANHDKLLIWLDENITNVVESITTKKITIQSTEWEMPVVQSSNANNLNSPKFIVGFIDYVVNLSFECPDTGAYGMGRIFFEAKTKIPSLGELLRQLKFYSTYAKFNTRIAVLSTDSTFKKQIEANGFSFVNPEDYK